MSNWKFWATLEGYCCKSDTYGAKTKGHENAGTKIANPRYSLGLDCTIWSLWVNSWGLFCTFRSIGSICKESKGQGLVLQIMKKYPLESTSFLVVARRWRAWRRRRIPRLELRWKAWRRRDDDWSLITATARSTPALRLVDDDDGVYCGGDGELVADHSRWRFRSFHAGSSNAGSCLACTERESVDGLMRGEGRGFPYPHARTKKTQRRLTRGEVRWFHYPRVWNGAARRSNAGKPTRVIARDYYPGRVFYLVDFRYF